MTIPFIALSIYFHFQFTFALKESANQNLVAITESQRNTIDLFLQERVVNVFSLFQSETFSVIPTPATMENYLRSLRRISDAFIDVGFLNEKGIDTRDNAELAKHPEIVKLVQEIVDSKNQDLARFEQIKKFVILERDLLQEKDEITPTLKVKRNIVTENFKGLLEALYEI